jgi:hypothetical protein
MVPALDPNAIRSSGSAAPTITKAYKTSTSSKGFAYKSIRKDKGTCRLIVAAFEERIRFLNEAVNKVVPTAEHHEAFFESTEQEGALYEIYRLFGGRAPRDELIKWPEIL